MTRTNTTFKEWNRGYDQGSTAAELGKTIGDCPFSPGTEGEDGWIIGFEEGLAAKQTSNIYLKALKLCAGGLIAFDFLGPQGGGLQHRLFEDGWIPGLSEGMELAGVEYCA